MLAELRLRSRPGLLAAAAVLVMSLAVPGPGTGRRARSGPGYRLPTATSFEQSITRIEALPYLPAAFRPVLLHSFDEAPLTGEAGLHPGHRPAVLVVHGFNTHGDLSVIRWAAALYTDGFDVLAADQRDFAAEYSVGFGYPKWVQTFGWKESQDVLAAGTWLRRQPGVSSVGFSEGAQNAILALAQDRRHVFAAGMTFSGAADQDTQIASTGQPQGCQGDGCSYPVTDALTAAVVPPYDNANVCSVLALATRYYRTTGPAILAANRHSTPKCPSTFHC